jgi:AcrR family transcriptional regulator
MIDQASFAHANRQLPLAISRHAAQLFLEKGLRGTSGQEIADAAGVSVRTVWRLFGTKERCIAPVLSISIVRFSHVMQGWPDVLPLEDHLSHAMPVDSETPEAIADGVLAVRLLALTRTEPDLRIIWLEAYQSLETQLTPIIARRCNRSDQDFEVRLCAATITAAIRVVDETVSVAAIGGERHFTPEDLAGIMAGAIRDAATLPICDAVARDAFGSRSLRSGRAA